MSLSQQDTNKTFDGKHLDIGLKIREELLDKLYIYILFLGCKFIAKPFNT